MVVDPVSRTIIEFSWWWVIAGVAFWGLALAYYYRTFMTGKEAERVARNKKEKNQRILAERRAKIRGGLDEALRVARIGREAAEAAARAAEAAVDGPSARRAAEQAAAAAGRAEDSALAAGTNARMLISQRERKMLPEGSSLPGTEADADAAAARAAADRAAGFAAAKGAPAA